MPSTVPSSEGAVSLARVIVQHDDARGEDGVDDADACKPAPPKSAPTAAAITGPMPVHVRHPGRVLGRRVFVLGRSRSSFALSLAASASAAASLKRVHGFVSLGEDFRRGESRLRDAERVQKAVQGHAGGGFFGQSRRRVSRPIVFSLPFSSRPEVYSQSAGNVGFGAIRVPVRVRGVVRVDGEVPKPLASRVKRSAGEAHAPPSSVQPLNLSLLASPGTSHRVARDEVRDALHHLRRASKTPPCTATPPPPSSESAESASSSSPPSLPIGVGTPPPVERVAPRTRTRGISKVAFHAGSNPDPASAEKGARRDVARLRRKCPVRRDAGRRGCITSPARSTTTHDPTTSPFRRMSPKLCSVARPGPVAPPMIDRRR